MQRISFNRIKNKRRCATLLSLNSVIGFHISRGKVNCSPVILLLVLLLLFLSSSLVESLNIMAGTTQQDDKNIISIKDDDFDDRSSRIVIVPSIETLKKVLPLDITEPVFHNEEDEKACRRMVVDDLNNNIEEQSIAARTSYAYWAWEQIHNKNDNNDDDDDDENHNINELRIRMAMKEAHRHYIGQDRDYPSAIKRFQKTIQWRKENHIDLLKVCFSKRCNDNNDESNSDVITKDTDDSDFVVIIELSKEESDICTNYETLIGQDFNVQNMAVRGYDQEYRPMIVKLCREQPWDTETGPKSYPIAQYYIAERAIAVAELLDCYIDNDSNNNNCNDNSIDTIKKNQYLLTGMFDFSTYVSANSPPSKVLTETVKTLQDNYPERLGKSIILDAPFWMQALIKIIKPFLSQNTRNKIVMVSSTTLSLSPSSLLTSKLSLWGNSGGNNNNSDNGENNVKKNQNQREETMRKLVNPDQAMPFMMSDAKLSDTINVQQQLYQIPFFRLYDYHH